MFQQHIVKAGIISEDLARPLPQAFARRLQTDYGDFKQATGDEVAKLREDVEAFVAACERALNTA